MIKFVKDKKSIKLVNDDTKFENELKPGFYKVHEESFGIATIYSLREDLGIKIPENSIGLWDGYLNTEELKNNFSRRSTEIFSSLKMKQNTGILLHGIQGTGKTTMCYVLSEFFIKENSSIVISVYDIKSLEFAINFIREVQEYKDYYFVIIFDECDHTFYNYETTIKGILDSSNTINKTLFLFTTNYISKIPSAIKERPSRIKHCIEVYGISDEITIYSILKSLNSQLKEEYQMQDKALTDIIYSLKGQTLDQIKHAFLKQVL